MQPIGSHPNDLDKASPFRHACSRRFRSPPRSINTDLQRRLTLKSRKDFVQETQKADLRRLAVRMAATNGPNSVW